MLFIVVTASALTCFEMYHLFRQAGNKIFKTLLGYSWTLELTASIVLPALSLATGSLTAFLVSVVAGFFFTLTLQVAKKVVGTRKYVRGQGWVETDGMTLAQYLKGLGKSWMNRGTKFVSEITA